MQIDLASLQSLLTFMGKCVFIAFLIVGIGSYIFFCPPVLTSNNGGFILFPFPPGDEYNYDTINNVKREEVWFKNQSGTKLHGWFFQNQKKDAPVILFSHGNAGNIGNRLLLAKWLLDAGASVFLFDYRSFGKSEGKKDLQGIVQDTHSAYIYLTGLRKIPANRTVIYGESIGGGPTCELAKSAEVGGIILDSTFTSLMRVAKKKVAVFNIYPDFFQPIPALDNMAVLKGKHAPLLIIHGRLDEVIPYTEAEDNFAAASEPKQFLPLPKSTHNWKEPDVPLYIEGIRKFLEKIGNNK